MSNPILYQPYTTLTVNTNNVYSIHVFVYLGEKEKLVKNPGDPSINAGTVYLRYTVEADPDATQRYVNDDQNFELNQMLPALVKTVITKNAVNRTSTDSTDRAEPAAG